MSKSRTSSIFALPSFGPEGAKETTLATATGELFEEHQASTQSVEFLKLSGQNTWEQTLLIEKRLLKPRRRRKTKKNKENNTSVFDK